MATAPSSIVRAQAATSTKQAAAQAAEANSAGIEAMRAKKEDEALAHFQRAYALDPNHKILWNLARVHELTAKTLEADSRLTEARDRLAKAQVGFRLLVKDPQTPPKVVALATTKLEAVNTRISALDARALAAKHVKKPRFPSLKEQPAMISYKTEALISLAAGVAATGVGIYLMVDAGNTRAEMADATQANGLVSSLTQREALALQDDANTFETVGVVGVVLGGTLITTGIILFLLEPDGDEDAVNTSVVVAPAISPNGFLLSTQGRF
ncbi:MAG: tetratricopeptide (TPR) repeat protein [Myxococcota bacterium]|jgi:tetratricopeptide (TPR) repeat protein